MTTSKNDPHGQDSADKIDNSLESCENCDEEKIEADNDDGRWWLQPLIIGWAGVFLVSGLVSDIVFNIQILTPILFLSAALPPGLLIGRHAVISLFRRHRFDINLLVVFAAIGAFAIGEAAEGAAVLFLFSVAEYIEELATDRSRKAIWKILSLAPENAIVRRNGKWIEVHAHNLKEGEIVAVHSGERIPIDGVVCKGESAVDQSPITGESVPVDRGIGDEVFAGSFVDGGYLEVEVTRPFNRSTLARMAELVRQAEMERSPTERLVDRFAKYYTPLMLILALLVALLPPLLLAQDASTWVYRALTFLVISCPCALVLSTPISIVSAITSASRHGVLIKGGRHLERMADVNVAALDKTGTITEGKLQVIDVVSNDRDSENLLRIARTLEAGSQHPIANAIKDYASKKGISIIATPKRIRSITGSGVKARIDGIDYYAGRPRKTDYEHPRIGKALKNAELDGFTTIVIIRVKPDELLGFIKLRDELRPHSVAAVSSLKKMGVDVVMLTGDNPPTAAAIAKLSGISDYRASLHPAEKSSAIKKLQQKHGIVAMFGDGVNDAPALATADVGIAMGGAGSDIAMETADIVVMNDEIYKIPYLIELSRFTRRIIKENITTAILVKACIAVLAFTGNITLWIAVGVGDMGLSLAVILNALRVAYKKPKNNA